MTPLTNRQVGQRIRKIRLDKAIKAEFVAEKLGMSMSNFTKYERGEVKKIDRDFLLRVSDILHANVSDIIGFDDIMEIQRNTENRYTELTNDQKWLIAFILKADQFKANKLRKLIDLMDD